MMLSGYFPRDVSTTLVEVGTRAWVFIVFEDVMGAGVVVNFHRNHGWSA